MIAYIPSPSSGVFHLGPLPIHAYGMMIAIGVIAGAWLGGRELERIGGGTTEQFSSAATWGVVAGIIGARLYHVITAWELFSNDLGRIPKIWEGGLGIPGGLILGIPVGLWIGRRRGVSMSALATAAAPAIPLAQSIGRWGNWWNQELYGRPTTLPWGLKIDPEHRQESVQQYSTFHPTFLYESLWNLGLCLVLLWISRHVRLKPGRLLALYVAGYGVGRFWVESLRIDPAKSGGGLRLNQWMAIAAVVLAVLFMVAFGLRDRSEPALVDEDDVVEETELADVVEETELTNDDHLPSDNLT